MKIIKQIQCPECKTWIKYEYEQEIIAKPRRCIELYTRLFDSLGYETLNIHLTLDINSDIDFEELKKRKKLLNRLALDYARLQGYKASHKFHLIKKLIHYQSTLYS